MLHAAVRLARGLGCIFHSSPAHHHQALYPDIETRNG